MQTKLPFKGQFAKDNFGRLDNKKIRKKLEKKFDSEYDKIVNIRYKSETVEYILFTGKKLFPFNPDIDYEKVKILVDRGGNIWVSPIDAEIIRPFHHKRQWQKTEGFYGNGNIY